MPTRVLVVGGGRVGTALVALLRDGCHDVTVLDERPAPLARLRSTFGADEANLVVTCLARFHFGVPRTVDPAKAWMYTLEMGVDAALNQADLIAHVVVEEMSLGEMTTLVKLRRGQYALVEERLHPDAPVAGRRLGDLTLPDECVVVAVLRDGTAMLHDPDVALRAGDEILAVAHTATAPALAALLSAPTTATGAERQTEHA
jgi:trk system potassium uptake protein